MKSARNTAVIVLGMLLVTIVGVSLVAAERTPTKKQPPLDAGRMIVILDRLLAEEQQLLQAVEEIKSELATVKVRASAPCPPCNSCCPS